MSFNTIPMICSMVLTTMSAVFFSSWWPNREIAVDLYDDPQYASPRTQQVPSAPHAPRTRSTPGSNAPVPAATPTPTPGPAPASAASRDSYEAILKEMRQLKTENMAIRDQMAEINRDLMKLEFRVDTHSESFRPLPVAEEESPQAVPVPEAGPSLLPPRHK